MTRFAQGIYTPKNPQKYIGKGTIRYRSSWELAFAKFCDSNDKVLQWASESIQIPYRNPITGKNTIYVPDFLITYQNNKGQAVAEVIEIKPKNQTLVEEKTTPANKAIILINYAKWGACSAWCKKHGMGFRVLNEDQIFHMGRKT